MGKIYLAHAARAQPREQPIGVHDTASQVFTDVRLEQQRRRGFQEGLDTIACSQQPIDPRAQHRVGSARLGKIRLAFGVVAGQRAFKDALHSRPIVQRVHLALSSLYSHNFAVAQSRFTVAGEMPRASAVSSTDKPTKNLSSTTRLC